LVTGMALTPTDGWRRFFHQIVKNQNIRENLYYDNAL